MIRTSLKPIVVSSYLLWCAASMAKEAIDCPSDKPGLDAQMVEFNLSASQVFSLRSGVKVAEQEYSNCLKSPDIYDPFSESCKSYQEEFHRRLAEYETQMLELEADSRSLLHDLKEYSNNHFCG